MITLQDTDRFVSLAQKLIVSFNFPLLIKTNCSRRALTREIEKWVRNLVMRGAQNIHLNNKHT